MTPESSAPTAPSKHSGVRTGHVSCLLVPVEHSVHLLTYRVGSLGAFLLRDVCGASEDDYRNIGLRAALSPPGLHKLGDILATRTEVPICMQETEDEVITTITSSALIPLPGGAMHINMTLTFVSVADGFDPIASVAEAMSAELLWMAVGDVDVAPVLTVMPAWFESIEIPVHDSWTSTPFLPDVELAEGLEALHDRIYFRDSVVDGLTVMVKERELAIQKAAESARRIERQHDRHARQISAELETQRAIAQRQRERADKAERSLRMGAVEQVTDVPLSSAAQESVPTAQDAEIERLKLVSQQQMEEIDRLRGEVYRLRDEAARRDSAQVLDSIEVDRPLPTSLRAMASWAQATLGGRVVIHGKAARAARKSAFADPALVYRVLQAMATYYWPMRFLGDAGARAMWEEFLAAEHLSCGPTGAAVQDRRTRAFYLVDWHRRAVELDQHIQGDNSRDKARSFRIYFYVDASRQVILVGHLPSHLPNSLT